MVAFFESEKKTHKNHEVFLRDFSRMTKEKCLLFLFVFFLAACVFSHGCQRGTYVCFYCSFKNYIISLVFVASAFLSVGQNYFSLEYQLCNDVEVEVVNCENILWVDRLIFFELLLFTRKTLMKRPKLKNVSYQFILFWQFYCFN